MRRKGERPIARTIIPFDDAHPVARALGGGDRWFDAWMRQFCTPYSRLVKMTGITVDRLLAIEAGAVLTRSEIERLADAWRVTPDDLIVSTGGTAQIIG